MVLGSGFRALHRKATQRTTDYKPASDGMEAVLGRMAAMEVSLAQFGYNLKRALAQFRPNGKSDANCAGNGSGGTSNILSIVRWLGIVWRSREEGWSGERTFLERV